VLSESCPYCGEMTPMLEDSTDKGHWISTKCKHCNKDLAAVAASVPERVDEKPDLKAPDQGVLP